MRIECDSMQLTINGQSFPGLKSVQWDEPAFKDVPIPLGVTEGTYKAEGSLTITKEGWERFWPNQPRVRSWKLGGGNARDRRKRRRAAQLGG